MTQGDPDDNVQHSTSTPAPTTAAGHLPPEKPDVPEYKYYPTDTIAAVTIAVLAVVIILTLLLVIRALRKRRRARQGEQFGHIQTVTTGVMGTGNDHVVHLQTLICILLADELGSYLTQMIWVQT